MAVLAADMEDSRLPGAGLPPPPADPVGRGLLTAQQISGGLPYSMGRKDHNRQHQLRVIFVLAVWWVVKACTMLGMHGSVLLSIRMSGVVLCDNLCYRMLIGGFLLLLCCEAI